MEDTRVWLWWYNQRSGPFTIARLYDINNLTPFWSERSKQWLPLLHLLHDMYPDRERLDQMQRAGIKRVKVIGWGPGWEDRNCDACRKLIDCTYPIDAAPELPPKDCACTPWCGCLHIAIE